MITEKHELFEQAKELVTEKRYCSADLLQQKFKITYSLAGKLIDALERAGVISEFDGSKKRRVLLPAVKPKKLIREFITAKLKEGEWETITDQNELNKLYALKLKEELAEIQSSEHKDISEFVDLIQVAMDFAIQNGFAYTELSQALAFKRVEKGCFGRLALNNLNPNNPSNKIYFETEKENIKP